MHWLDMRTVMFSHVVTEALGVMFILILLRQSRGRFRGIRLWLGGFSLQLAGTVLIAFRGTPLPSWISIVLANTLVIAGGVTFANGILRFIGKKIVRLPAVLLVLAFASSYVFFVLIRPSLAARTWVNSSVFIVIFVSAIVLMSGASPEFRRFVARMRGVYLFLTLASLFRITGLVLDPIVSEDFFKVGTVETLVLLAYQTGLVLMVFNLILGINERLIDEARFQEEKYAKAFRSSPYALMLTDAATGRIIEVNEGFTENLGYARDEAVGKTTLELGIWERDADRRQMLETLASRGKLHENEYRFRTKSGEIITGLWSAEQIVVNNRPSILSTLNDITLRKKAREALNQSLREKELLMRELTHRVKNSLAVISSLMGLSRESATDPGVKAVLSDLRARVMSMSSVYDLLNRTGRVDVVELKPYIQNLADSLVRSYGPSDGRIRIATDLADLNLETKRAIPLGLILNEMILNAFKYAFPDGRSGEIRIELKSVTGGLCLTVSDDGVGRTNGVVSAGGGGSGSSLVETLADQIDARVSYPPGPGTTAVLIL